MAKKYQSSLGEQKIFQNSTFVQHEDIKNHITVIAELEALIPPLSQDELEQLEANLLKNGCRESLLVWPTTENTVSPESTSPLPSYVLIDGHNISTLKEKELTLLRLEKLGFIFQSFNLINVLSVYQNVEMPLLLQGRFTKAEREKKIKTIVDRVGLTKFITHRPNELSGGQRQRVSIARALITNPRIVLADEPTANLDSVTGKEIIDLMKEINEQEKTTFIFSTHDDRVVSRVERIIPIEDGLIKTEAAAH